jgi:uncharacterized DUF497 family protein
MVQALLRKGRQMTLRFEWDLAKAARNTRKLHVDFDEAATVFADPLAAVFDDEEHSDIESREIIIGHSVLGRLLVVSFVEVARYTVRVISARPATRAERKEYEENQST